jgi:hypothetical protein
LLSISFLQHNGSEKIKNCFLRQRVFVEERTNAHTLKVFSDWVQEHNISIGLSLKAKEMGSVKKENNQKDKYKKH